jgi:hypothetical protein
MHQKWRNNIESDLKKKRSRTIRTFLLPTIRSHPEMPPKPAPPPTTLTLRPDRDAHPGEIDKARHKRTPDEMKKLRQDTAARKTEAAEKRKAGIAKAAVVEVRQESEDQANDRDGNNPPPTTIQKVLRCRPEQTTEPSNEGSGMFSALLRTVLTFSVLQATTGVL